MENPVEKKRFPWGWVAAGCTLAVVAAIAVSVVIVLVALPAVRSRLAAINTPQIQIQQGAPLVSSTPTQGSSSGSTTSIGNLPFKFSAVQNPSSLMNQSLMDKMVTALNLNNDSDFMAPKTYTGTATLDPSSSFTLGNGWCAKDPTTLRQNLANMQFQLSINGTNIDLSKYPTINFTDSNGHACAMTGIEITPSGPLNSTYHMVLTQKFLSKLDDGITSSPYPAGDVTFDFTIQFSGGLNPGNNA